MNELVLLLSDREGLPYEIVGPFPDNEARQKYINDHPSGPGMRWHLRGMKPPEET